MRLLNFTLDPSSSNTEFCRTSWLSNKIGWTNGLCLWNFNAKPIIECSKTTTNPQQFKRRMRPPIASLTIKAISPGHVRWFERADIFLQSSCFYQILGAVNYAAVSNAKNPPITLQTEAWTSWNSLTAPTIFAIKLPPNTTTTMPKLLTPLLHKTVALWTSTKDKKIRSSLESDQSQRPQS